MDGQKIPIDTFLYVSNKLSLAVNIDPQTRLLLSFHIIILPLKTVLLHAF